MAPSKPAGVELLATHRHLGARFLEETSELGASARRLTWPQLLHEDGDAGADASLAAEAVRGGLGEDLGEIRGGLVPALA